MTLEAVKSIVGTDGSGLYRLVDLTGFLNNIWRGRLNAQFRKTKDKNDKFGYIWEETTIKYLGEV